MILRACVYVTPPDTEQAARVNPKPFSLPLLAAPFSAATRPLGTSRRSQSDEADRARALFRGRVALGRTEGGSVLGVSAKRTRPCACGALAWGVHAVFGDGTLDRTDSQRRPHPHPHPHTQRPRPPPKKMDAELRRLASILQEIAQQQRQQDHLQQQSSAPTTPVAAAAATAAPRAAPGHGMAAGGGGGGPLYSLSSLPRAPRQPQRPVQQQYQQLQQQPSSRRPRSSHRAARAHHHRQPPQQPQQPQTPPPATPAAPLSRLYCAPLGAPPLLPQTFHDHVHIFGHVPAGPLPEGFDVSSAGGAVGGGTAKARREVGGASPPLLASPQSGRAYRFERLINRCKARNYIALATPVVTAAAAEEEESAPAGDRHHFHVPSRVAIKVCVFVCVREGEKGGGEGWAGG
jgi:hypothetical protein